MYYSEADKVGDNNMRPIVLEQNPLRYPLNELLGTQANVRLLRVMANEVEGPLAASDVAERAGLTIPGAQKALARLFRTGFISCVGGGKKHQYEIRRSDRLMQIILELFQAEKRQYEQLISNIKKKIQCVTPPPNAAWIETCPKKSGDSIKLGILHDIRYLTDYVSRLRTKLSDLENLFDITIEVGGYAKADISDLQLDNVMLLYGVLQSLETSSPLMKILKKYGDKDRQLLILSSALGEIIQKDHALVRRAKDHLSRLLNENQGTATKDLTEWQDILNTYSINRLVTFLRSSSERAKRLRQSNPFFAVLNRHEQKQLTNILEKSNDT